MRVFCCEFPVWFSLFSPSVFDHVNNRYYNWGLDNKCNSGEESDDTPLFLSETYFDKSNGTRFIDYTHCDCYASSAVPNLGLCVKSDDHSIPVFMTMVNSDGYRLDLTFMTYDVVTPPASRLIVPNFCSKSGVKTVDVPLARMLRL